MSQSSLIDWQHRDSLYAALALLRDEQAAHLRGSDVFDLEVQRVSMIADRVLVRLREQVDEISHKGEMK